MHTSDPCSLTVWMEVCVGLAIPSCSAPQMPPKHRSLGQQWETFQHRSHSPCYTCALLSLPNKHLLIPCSPGPALSAYILLWHLTFVPQIPVQSILTPAEKQVAPCQPAPWELRPHTNFLLIFRANRKDWVEKQNNPSPSHSSQRGSALVTSLSFDDCDKVLLQAWEGIYFLNEQITSTDSDRFRLKKGWKV